MLIEFALFATLSMSKQTKPVILILYIYLLAFVHFKYDTSESEGRPPLK